MTSRPSTEQLLAQVLLRAIDELLAALDAHGPDSPERRAAEEELGLAFPPLWHRVPRLALRCMNDGIWWDDVRVLAADEGRSRLLETLVSSGIQGLELEPGVEKEEIRRFVELVDEKARLDPHADKDLVMMLFQADLHHLGYSVRPSEDEAEEPTSAPATTGTDPEALKEAVRADVEADGEKGVVELEEFDSTLYFLDDREIEYLRAQIERQYTTDHTRSVLALLLDTLQTPEAHDVRDETLSAIRTFLPYLLASGNFTSLAYLTSELRGVLRGTEMAEPQRERLAEMLHSVSERGTLTQIFFALEDGRVTPTAESLGILLRQLDADALDTVLVWSGQLGRRDAKDALLTALEDLFREWPAHLVRILESRDRSVVQRGLMMAGRIRLPDLVEGVGAALRQDDATTRKLAVEILGSIGGSRAMRDVMRALGDDDSTVRMAAYRAFLSRPYRSAAKGFREVLSSTDLEALGLSERKLLFSAFGAVVGPEGVADLERILAGKRVAGRRPSSETRACAALGLEQIESPVARDLLEEATRARDPLVRSAASSALRSRH